jgi:hypothetical protein
MEAGFWILNPTGQLLGESFGKAGSTESEKGPLTGLGWRTGHMKSGTYAATAQVSQRLAPISIPFYARACYALCSAALRIRSALTNISTAKTSQ